MGPRCGSVAEMVGLHVLFRGMVGRRSLRELGPPYELRVMTRAWDR